MMQYATFVSLALALSAVARPVEPAGAQAAVGTNSSAVVTNSTASTANLTVAAATVSNSTAAAVNSTAGVLAATTSAASSSNLQSSHTLDPAVIATGFANNGQAVQEAGQVPSLTSTNNFINFCATVPGLPITNGLQIATGSCNPAPMGIIAGTQNMPSAKFVFPTNGATIQSNTPFTITMAINKLVTGNFVNAEENYFAAPQQTDPATGDVTGHSHVVIEALDALDQTTPTDPNTFAFFKGLNAAATNGQLTTPVAKGLPNGAYRLASINTAANHQPVLVAVAQHGSLDDMVYFTVSDNAAAASNSTAVPPATAAPAKSTGAVPSPAGAGNATAKATTAASAIKQAPTAASAIKQAPTAAAPKAPVVPVKKP